MADNVLKYLSVVYTVAENMVANMDQALYQADNGENTSMEDGKDRAWDEADSMIDRLKEFRGDIKALSLKKLNEKYQ